MSASDRRSLTKYIALADETKIDETPTEEEFIAAYRRDKTVRTFSRSIYSMMLSIFKSCPDKDGDKLDIKYLQLFLAESLIVCHETKFVDRTIFVLTETLYKKLDDIVQQMVEFGILKYVQ